MKKIILIGTLLTIAILILMSCTSTVTAQSINRNHKKLDSWPWPIDNILGFILYCMLVFIEEVVPWSFLLAILNFFVLIWGQFVFRCLYSGFYNFT